MSETKCLSGNCTCEAQQTDQIKPLDRFVSEDMGEADPKNPTEVREAIRRFHNKLANGSIPRTVIRKIGKHLYVHMGDWKSWIRSQ